MRAKFCRRPFPVRQLSCLQNDSQNDHNVITCALLAEVITTFVQEASDVLNDVAIFAARCYA